MVLTYGDCTSLKGSDWYMIELRSEKTVESTMRRVGKSIPSIFRRDPVEIFIPVVKRDLDVYELSTGPYVFVRSSNFQSLLRLKTITGCVSLVTEGESNRPSKAIKVEDSYVQNLISLAEEEFRNRGVGLEVGSFVRILNGEVRDYCGVIEAIGDGKTIVRINLKTKSILLETPLRNLLNISHVPENQRVYYYSPLVAELANEEEENGLKLVEPDLKLSSPSVPDSKVEISEGAVKRHSRQKTVTALVKRLIMIEGLHEPMVISKKVVEALREGDIKKPKNYFIIHGIIKDHLLKDHFSRIDPSIRVYRDVITKYGKGYKFSPQKIADIDISLGIPIMSKRRLQRPPAAVEGKRRGRPPKNVEPVAAKEPLTRKRTLSEKGRNNLIEGLKKWHASRKKTTVSK